MNKKDPTADAVIPTNIKLALLAFIVAKLSGIAAMISLFAGLRETSKVFLITAGICLFLSVISSLVKSKQAEFSQLEIDAVKNLIKNGKLEALIKQVQTQG